MVATVAFRISLWLVPMSKWGIDAAATHVEDFAMSVVGRTRRRRPPWMTPI